ncbi:hypothetical protein CQZ93_26010 [Ochrobactrum vermis]|nr:hypothetical protein CQZ93_26010 [Ochrobactrum vermis]
MPLKHNAIAWTRLCTVAVMLPLGACTEKVPDIDPVAMAEDVRIVIGGESFILPQVAIDRTWNGGFQVWIGVYGSTGELLKSREICPLLTRQWSRSICESAFSPLYQSLPDRLAIMRPSALPIYGNAFLADTNQSKYDVVAGIQFSLEKANLACSNATSIGHRFCFAGIGLDNGLIALWNAEDRSNDNRMGKMVQSFVKNAIGLTEDFSTLDRDAVKLRKPFAPCFAGQPYDKKTMARVQDYADLLTCTPGQ